MLVGLARYLKIKERKVARPTWLNKKEALAAKR